MPYIFSHKGHPILYNYNSTLEYNRAFWVPKRIPPSTWYPVPQTTLQITIFSFNEHDPIYLRTELGMNTEDWIRKGFSAICLCTLKHTLYRDFPNTHVDIAAAAPNFLIPITATAPNMLFFIMVTPHNKKSLKVPSLKELGYFSLFSNNMFQRYAEIFGPYLPPTMLCELPFLHKAFATIYHPHSGYQTCLRKYH